MTAPDAPLKSFADLVSALVALDRRVGGVMGNIEDAEPHFPSDSYKHDYYRLFQQLEDRFDSLTEQQQEERVTREHAQTIFEGIDETFCRRLLTSITTRKLAMTESEEEEEEEQRAREARAAAAE